MSYGCCTCLSTSELFDYSYSHRIFDGIQQAEEGSSPDQQPWYNESSPYTLRKARAEAVKLDQGYSTPVTTSVNTLSTSSYHTASSDNHHRGSLSAFPQEVQEEEDLWYEDLAIHSSLTDSSGDQVALSQRAPPRDGGPSRMSLDTSDFMGGPVRGS